MTAETFERFVELVADVFNVNVRKVVRPYNDSYYRLWGDNSSVKYRLDFSDGKISMGTDWSTLYMPLSFVTYIDCYKFSHIEIDFFADSMLIAKATAEVPAQLEKFLELTEICEEYNREMDGLGYDK